MNGVCNHKTKTKATQRQRQRQNKDKDKEKESIDTFQVLYLCVEFSSQLNFYLLQEPENVKMLSPKIFEFFAAEAKVEKVQEKTFKNLHPN